MESVEKGYAFISKEVKDCWVVRTLIERSERDRRQKEEFSSKSQQDEKTPAELVQEKVAEIDRRIELQRKAKPKRLTLLDIPDDTYDFSLNPQPPPPPPAPLTLNDLSSSSRANKDPTPSHQRRKSPKKTAGISSSTPNNNKAFPLSSDPSPSTNGGIFELDDYLHEDDSQPEWVIKADPVVFEGRRVFAYKSQDLKKANAKSHIQLLRPFLPQQQQQREAEDSKYTRSSRGEPEILFEGPMVINKTKRAPQPLQQRRKSQQLRQVPPEPSGVLRKEIGWNKSGVVNPYNWTTNNGDLYLPSPSQQQQKQTREASSQFYGEVVPGLSNRTPNTAALIEGRRRSNGGGGAAAAAASRGGIAASRDREGKNPFGLGIQPLTQKVKGGKTVRIAKGLDPVVSSILECIGCPRKDQKLLHEVFTEITDEIKGKDPLRIKSLMRNRFIDWPDAVVQWRTELHKDGTYDAMKKRGVFKHSSLL